MTSQHWRVQELVVGGMIPPLHSLLLPLSCPPFPAFTFHEAAPYIQIWGLGKCCISSPCGPGQSPVTEHFLCILNQKKITYGCNNLPNIVQYNIFKKVPICSCCFGFYCIVTSCILKLCLFFTDKNCSMPVGMHSFYPPLDPP